MNELIEVTQRIYFSENNKKLLNYLNEITQPIWLSFRNILMMEYFSNEELKIELEQFVNDVCYNYKTGFDQLIFINIQLQNYIKCNELPLIFDEELFNYVSS